MCQTPGECPPGFEYFINRFGFAVDQVVGNDH